MKYEFWIKMFAYSHAMVNPIIYICFNNNFKKAFKRLICCSNEELTFEYSNRKYPVHIIHSSLTDFNFKIMFKKVGLNGICLQSDSNLTYITSFQRRCSIASFPGEELFQGRRVMLPLCMTWKFGIKKRSVLKVKNLLLYRCVNPNYLARQTSTTSTIISRTSFTRPNSIRGATNRLSFKL